MSKQKNPPASHQKTLQKINTLSGDVEEFKKLTVTTVNHNIGKIRILEMVLDQMLEDQVEEHELADFDEAVFNKEYGFLFGNYFMHMDTKDIIKVNFPELEDEEEEQEEIKEEELEDELLDNGK